MKNLPKVATHADQKEAKTEIIKEVKEAIETAKEELTSRMQNLREALFNDLKAQMGTGPGSVPTLEQQGTSRGQAMLPHHGMDARDKSTHRGSPLSPWLSTKPRTAVMAPILPEVFSPGVLAKIGLYQPAQVQHNCHLPPNTNTWFRWWAKT